MFSRKKAGALLVFGCGARVEGETEFFIQFIEKMLWGRPQICSTAEHCVERFPVHLYCFALFFDRVERAEKAENA